MCENESLQALLKMLGNVGSGESMMLNGCLQLQQQQMVMGNQMLVQTVNGQHMPVVVGVPLAACLLEKRKQEDDRFIVQQVKSFTVALQRLRTEHDNSLLKLLELKTSMLLKDKDEQILRVARRTLELQEFIRRGEMEIQAWQKIAKEHETVALDLNNRIQQIQQNNYRFTGPIELEQALSCEPSCCSSSPATRQSQCIKEEEGESSEVVVRRCRWCRSGDPCMLFLPCRHLSACKACAEFLTTCPVCSTVKQGSFEVFLS